MLSLFSESSVRSFCYMFMLRFRIKSNLELTLYTGIALGSWGKVFNGSCFTQHGIANIRSHAYCTGCVEQKYSITYIITSMVIKFPVDWPLHLFLSGVFNRCWWDSNERRAWQAVCCSDTRSNNVLTSHATDNYCSASNVFPELRFYVHVSLRMFYAI